MANMLRFVAQFSEEYASAPAPAPAPHPNGGADTRELAAEAVEPTSIDVANVPVLNDFSFVS